MQPQAREIVEHFPLRAIGDSREFASFLRRPHLSGVSGLRSMTVELCALRRRVFFCSAGIHGTCTVAARILSRSPAIISIRFSRLG